MATQDIVKSFKGAIALYDVFDTDRLVSRPDWGTINFERARFDINRIFSLIQYLKVLPIEQLPDSVARTSTDYLKRANDVFNRVNQFTLAGADPSQRSAQLVNEIHSHVEQITQSIAEWIPFLAYQNGDVTKNINALTSAVKESRQLMDDAKLEIEKKRVEIEEITKSAREASASAGVAVFTQDFAKEAESQSKIAIAWLVATFIFAVIAFGISVWAYFVDYSGMSREVLLAKWVSKAFCLSILISATMWCGKMYKSARHLSIVNKHRAHSLRTFQAFVAASSNMQTRDAVLMETTKAIFARGTTGLVNESLASESDTSNIIQIAGKAIESVSPAKG